ncbi:aminodeoxychorismate synthase component I [Thalassobacillus hwangdonensis]|uniref:Aminodeoxychorismate synthase component I n=1 Tax=Thalassobacillus hwangdonensis TaxID=546108 RepID=A0ABW3L5H3_9BACI
MYELLFEFPDNVTGKATPRMFEKPVRILQANELDEVEEVFEEVNHALDQGYYVAGYVSYEAAPAFDPAFQVHEAKGFPLVWFGVYEQMKQGFPSGKDESYQLSDWNLDGDFASYQQGISKIRQAIEDGDTYQVNYTVRMKSKFEGDDNSFYRQLARNQKGDYSAHLNTGRYRILSASPELFFKVDNGRITTKPMKGTSKRGRYSKEDEVLKETLRHSEKDQAENLMIVDLLRNDVGRIAEAGTVNVPKLFSIESYPTVHQMTSTIEAVLKQRMTPFDWFKALFPCGSITGAPKVSTMRFISELEQSARRVYCGAIGYMTPEREAIFNVPIRTVTIDTDTDEAVYGTGGGITWDSTAEGEYEELLTKARLLTEKRKEFQLLETLRMEAGEFPLLDYHMKRLTDSVRYFGFAVPISRVIMALEKCRKKYPDGNHKVRVLVSEGGEVDITATPIKREMNTIRSSIASAPIDRMNPFLFNKTTERSIYENLQQQAPTHAETVLLWNDKDELTEFTIGNLVIEKNGEYYTPPVECGLLPGTRRQQLLVEGILKEQVITKHLLDEADQVWMINSVRGWVKVSFIY